MALKRSSLRRIVLLALACLMALAPAAAQDTAATSQFTPIQSGIRFEHPQDWMAVELPDASAVIVVNDPAYLGGDGNLSSGQMRIDIFTPRTMAAIIPTNADTTPADILQSFVDGSDLPLSDAPLEIEIGERRAAEGEITSGPITTTIYALEVESGAFALIFVTVLSDDQDALLPAALDLIATVALYTVEIEDLSVETETLTETFSAGDFSFRYPENWFLDSGEEDGSLITLTEGRPLGDEDLPDITVLILYAPVPFGTGNLDQYPRQVVETNLALAPGYIDTAERIPFTLNGRTALRVVGDDGELSSIAVAVLIDDVAFGYIFASALADDLDHMRESVLAIAASFEFAPTEFEAISAEAGDDLTVDFTSLDRATRFSYPSDWLVQDRNGLIFVSNAAPQDIGTVEAGQAVLILAAVPYNVFRGIRDKPTPMDVLYQIQPVIGLDAGTPGYTSFNDQSAARANLTAPGLEGMILVFELDSDQVMTMVIYANEGELAEYEDILLGIVANAQGGAAAEAS